MFHDLSAWLFTNHTTCTTVDTLWLSIGFLGQGMFASRFFIQLFKSEMEGRSVVPVAFWYFSLGGGLITAAYSIHLGQVGLPFLMGQLGGLVVYVRNLVLIHRERGRQAA